MMLLIAFLASTAFIAAASDAAAEDSDLFSLLQVRPANPSIGASEQINPKLPLAHYWPHIRGHPGKYSVSDYPMKLSGGNLSKSLLWTRDFGTNEVLWNSVIDHERNIYVAGLWSLTKFSPTGQLLWQRNRSTFSAILIGNAVCGQSNFESRTVFCLSQKTGEEFWEREAYPTAGIGSNFIEGHNGVLLVAGGLFFVEGLTSLTGQSNDRAIALNASTGSELWQFKPPCGLLQLMGLFPDDDTTLFQDHCGGMYRLGLTNGSLIWYTPGSAGSLSDGMAILGPDGSAYACSMAPGSLLFDNSSPHKPGVLRKFRLSDGAVLWSAETPYPCTNVGAVTADGGTVVLAPGAIPFIDGPFVYYQKQILALPKELQEAVHTDLDRRMRENSLRKFYGVEDLTGAIMGFDTHTGKVTWRHEVPPSGMLQAAGDQERNWWGSITMHSNFTDNVMPHCGPPHWSAPTVDYAGNVYIGDSAKGEIRVYNPRTDEEVDFHTEDGFLLPGATAAPGMMVFLTCQRVLVFKAEEA